MAGKPADREHPFGHGRIEYIAALVVAFLVIQVGLTFFKSSLDKIRHPEDLSFDLVSMLILTASVAVKLWLGRFNKALGKRINSSVMQAAAADALGDVVTTLATMGSILFFHFTQINIDGFVGLLVSLVVMWAGIGIARDTLEPLIGQPARSEAVPGNFRIRGKLRWDSGEPRSDCAQLRAYPEPGFHSRRGAQ